MEDHSLDVIFLVHGSGGSPEDWTMFIDFLDLHFEETAKIYACVANQGKKTDDGILVCGKRLADEVMEYLSGSMEGGAGGYLRINFVTHGIGALIVRAALKRLYNNDVTRPCESVQWQSFMSLHGPHLGRLKNGVSLGNMFRFASKKLGYQSRTTLDLTHTTNVLRQLCCNDDYVFPLASFQVRTLVSIVDGSSTPYTSASLCASPGYDFNLLSASPLRAWDFPSCFGVVGVAGPFPSPDIDNLMFELPDDDGEWEPLECEHKDGKMYTDQRKEAIFPQGCLEKLRTLQWRNIDVALKLPLGSSSILNPNSNFLLCKKQSTDTIEESESLVDMLAKTVHFDSKIFVAETGEDAGEEEELEEIIIEEIAAPAVGEGSFFE